MEVTMHPLADSLPTMIETLGPVEALHWWLTWAMDWSTDAAFDLSTEAIHHVAQGDLNHVLTDDDGDIARAFQWVRIFGLEPFVTLVSS
jgi:hypothetical protein